MESFDTVCRSCLRTAGTFSYFIFENVSPELYSFCTSIEVKLDNLPRSLCTECYELLKRFSEFKKTCLQSEETLLGSLTTLKLEQEQDDNPESTEEFLKKEIKEIVVKSENLDSSFQDDQSDIDLSSDIVEHHMKTSPRKKVNILNAKRTKQKKKSKLNLACKICNKKFVFLERLQAHQRLHDKKKEPMQCKPCNKTFTSFSGMHQHQKSFHTLITFQDLTCKVCSKVCKTPLTLKTHQRTHVAQKSKICDECGKGFRTELTLKNHLETHKNRTKSYVCEHCGKKYLTKSTRGKHIYRRHTERRFICHYCNLPFADKSNLSKHIMIHEGKQKLYKCNLCSRALTSQASLVLHKRIHTGERPFACSHCPKTFSSKGILNDHQRTHTGEKPYKCKKCEKCFTQRGSMRRHMKVHDKHPT